MFDHELVFNSAPGLYLVLAPDLTILGASDAYLRATMTRREDIVGRGLFDVFPDEPGDSRATGVLHLRESLSRVLSDGAPDAMAVQRYPIPRPEAEGGGFEERYWSPSNFPVFAPDGRLSCIIHAVEDVTEFLQAKRWLEADGESAATFEGRHAQVEMEIFRRAQEIQQANRRLRSANEELRALRQRLEERVQEREEALRTSDERFRLLVDGITDYAIYTLDSRGYLTTWNSGAANLMGYAVDEIVGRDRICLFPEEERHREGAMEDLVRAASTGGVSQEGWRVRKDGTRFWAVGVLTALFDAAGDVRGYVSVSRDLTEQRRAEALLRSIVDTALDGIITIDAEGTVQTFNRAAEQMFEYPAEEVIGRNVSLLMPEPYRGEHSGYLSRYLATGEARVIGIGREVEGRRKDGSVFPMELAVSRFEQDVEVCFTGLVRDISARKKLERQLQVSQKMEAVGQFAAGVAHDFNNLLTVISGYGEILTSALPKDGRPWAMVQEIRNAAEKAAALTAQLLAFSRRQVLEPRILDLNVLVTEMARMLKRLVGEDVDLTVRLDPELKTVRADAGQLNQVLMNLVINARDAMPEGGRLAIETGMALLDERFARTHPGSSRGTFVRLTVSDTGCGMDAETAARVFEPFFTTKEVGKGTGLGLAVVHGIVQQSGGHVDVYSEPGIGTTFKVYLPALEDTEGGTRVPPATDGGEASATILLVEDEDAVRGLAVEALRTLGYRVLEAAHGRAALAILDSGQAEIDLLVTDVVMPEMSGRHLAETVRQKLPGIRVLFMSGYTDDMVVRHGLLDAAVSFLQKPFTPASLGRKVREALDAPE